MKLNMTPAGRELLDKLPLPIAIAWERLYLSKNYSDAFRMCKNILDVFLRYTTSILLSTYLRHGPEEAVEDALKKLARPSITFLNSSDKYHCFIFKLNVLFINTSH